MLYILSGVETNICTSASENGRTFAWKKWGLVPGWAKDPSIGNKLFNARGETVAEKPSFRSAFKRRRCLVVADGFYEWSPRPAHVPHWFHPTSGVFLALAGLHEHWESRETGEEIESATVITTAASADLAGIHHRMPVILGPNDWGRWLEPQATVDDLRALLVSAPPGSLTALPVSRRVNSPKNDDPDLIDAEF